jgi:hypothetical protein
MGNGGQFFTVYYCHGFELTTRLLGAPPAFSDRPSRSPRLRAPPGTSPYLILSRMFRAAHCRARPSCELGPQSAPRARSGRRQATLGFPKGVFRGCDPEGPALKCFLNFLYSPASQPSHTHTLTTTSNELEMNPVLGMDSHCSFCAMMQKV